MTDLTTPPARVTPIQADREAAADLEWIVGDKGYSYGLRSPTSFIGDEDPRIQAFARHRLAALSEREQAVQEALAEATGCIEICIQCFERDMTTLGGLMSIYTLKQAAQRYRAILATLAAAKAEDHPVATEGR